MSLPTPECFWGVDPHTRHFAVGVVGEHNNVAVWRTTEIPSFRSRALDEAGQAWELHEAVRAYALDLRVYWPPTVVVVEQPVGKHPAPTLVGAWGVTLAACRSAVTCPIITLKPPEWKKEAGLPGNAAKELMLAQAIAELGYKGESEHEADALWMSVAARNLYQRRLNP